jgi:hypothetical protein
MEHYLSTKLPRYRLLLKPTSISKKIYFSQKKYLLTNANSSRVHFSANHEDNAGQFVFFFHPQNKKPGLSVDISTLAGSFLNLEEDNFIMANSSEAPYPKLLIIPVDE